MTTRQRPVGFVTTQVLTVASSSAVLGITTFLSAQSAPEVALEVPTDNQAVVGIVNRQVPTFNPLTGLPNLVANPPAEISPESEPTAATPAPQSPAVASAPADQPPAPAAEPSPAPAPAPEPAPAPAPAPAPVDAVSSGS